MNSRQVIVSAVELFGKLAACCNVDVYQHVATFGNRPWQVEVIVGDCHTSQAISGGIAVGSLQKDAGK